MEDIAETIEAGQLMVQTSCTQLSEIQSHRQGLNAAHEKLRDHESALERLKSLWADVIDRLNRVEVDALSQKSSLVSLESAIESVRVQQMAVKLAIDDVASTSHATYDALIKHMASSSVEAAATAQERIDQHVSRSTKIITLGRNVGLVAVMLILIYSAVSGNPLLSLLGVR
jgi:hypothetical protein